MYYNYFYNSKPHTMSTISNTSTKAKYAITTVRELRRQFWEQHPQFKSHYRARKSQNQYNADICSHWCFFVDSMHRNNMISERLSTNATL